MSSAWKILPGLEVLEDSSFFYRLTVECCSVA